MTDGTRPSGADGAVPAVPAWFNLDALVDAEIVAELHHLAEEVEALERSFVDLLAPSCYRILRGLDGIRIDPDGTFGEIHELMYRLSGAGRLGDALYRLSAHSAAAAGERTDQPLEWLTPLRAELGLDEWHMPVNPLTVVAEPTS